MFLSDNINIVDTQTPIMVMVGPIGSGKTMVAYRLFNWLFNNGYNVTVDRVFLPATIKYYQQYADEFPKHIFDRYPSPPTHSLSLYKVLDNLGNSVLQVFDSTGYEWFEHNNYTVQKTYSPQILQVINSPNKKIWVYLTEPEWQDIPCRQSYVKSIQKLQFHIGKKDEHIVLYNKIDKIYNCMLSYDKMNLQEMIRMLDIEYPDLLNTFRNKNRITSLFKAYYCAIVPFITGGYMDNIDEQNVSCTSYYTAGPDEYPANLWKIIMKLK